MQIIRSSHVDHKVKCVDHKVKPLSFLVFFFFFFGVGGGGYHVSLCIYFSLFLLSFFLCASSFLPCFLLLLWLDSIEAKQPMKARKEKNKEEEKEEKRRTITKEKKRNKTKENKRKQERKEKTPG